MVSKPERPIRVLLEEIDKWAYVLSISTAIVLSGIYFWVSAWQAPKGFFSIIREYSLAIVPNLIPVFIIFAFSYVFLRRIQSIKSQQDNMELVERITSQVRDDLQVTTQIKEMIQDFRQQFEQTQEQVVCYSSRDELYSNAISNLNSGNWKTIRIFAPVGLWKKDDDKRRWLNELAEHASDGTVEEVWAVFGLPPKTEVENGIEKSRDAERISEDLEYVQETLSIFNGMTNVRLQFYPPAHASVGLGSIIFEKKDGTGQVAFALASHTDAEVVDTCFIIDDREVYSFALTWFDRRIFIGATSAFVLQDSTHSFKERWPKNVETWYGNI